ncbi:uncharacterized protein LOC110735860 [Chenopodium quinoa]|uniref:uncharacterized protein LOC110735860 n=1 Tax=Chenopodium quinoa TaxID=63459 RepID=UPI000B77C12E|nr:uncharacterized protein LOC110735860 [Chenopodium quinoa]
MKGWKEKYLSQAGREVLIKSIAQAIPTYTMQCFSVLMSILDEVEMLCRNVFWGQKREERKINWVALENLYIPKKQGGLGFQNMRSFNRALLAKQAWRILTKEDSLMEKVLKGKYFPNTSFMDAKIASNSSYTWSSIMSARDVLSKGIRKILGNGASIDIWKDPWVSTLPNFYVLSS